jgi:nucleotide-binding universal stress UspA family protein
VEAWTTKETVMIETTPRKVMVGVTTEEDVDAAVEFAVAEARRRSAGVHLVHVVHPVLISPDGVPISGTGRGPAYGVLVPVGPDGVGDGTLDVAAAEATRLGTGALLLHVVHSLVADSASTERIESFDAALTKVGRAALTDAEARMRSRVGDHVPVTTEIVFGHVARTLAERGSDGNAIIMERRDPGTFERIATMSISTSVAAHARVPVIVVPPSWTAASGDDLPVTVGIEAPTDAKMEIVSGLERARATGHPLVALYAAWIAEPYQGLALIGYPRDELVANATESLAASSKALPGARTT